MVGYVSTILSDMLVQYGRIC